MGDLLRQIALWPAWAKVVVPVMGILAVGAGIATPIALQATRGHRAPVAAKATPTPSPTPTVSATPVPVVLSCRLPISNGQPGGGGFVTFPAATFAPDSRSGVTIPGNGNVFGLSYNRAAGRWLPVPRPWVSPDGSHYAYLDFRNNTIHGITVATGADTYLGPKPNGAASSARLAGAGWQPIEALDEGLYAAPAGGPNATAGLWLFPFSGAGERQVTSSNYWHEIGGGGAWGTSSPSVPEGAANTIMRLDLRAGSTQDWFTRPGLQSHVMGFDADGHPVVQAISRDETQVWRLMGPGKADQLLAAKTNGNDPNRLFVDSVLGDRNGIWIATNQGLYLTTASGTQKVSTVTGQLAAACA